jgi:PKHD-type hydroxylase
MFRLIPVLSPEQVTQLREIAAASQFVDGRVSNPHSTVKNNLQLHDSSGQEKAGEILRQALLASEEFRDFTLPKAMAPPLLARYEPSMHYGLHTDAALMQFPRGVVRADVSCTVFLNDPASYDGGALRVMIGMTPVSFKEAPGVAVVYPSTTLHEVEPVTRGERLVGLTFVQSFVSDPAKREILFELNNVAGLEGLKMAPDNYVRLRAIRDNLERRWSDAP